MISVPDAAPRDISADNHTTPHTIPVRWQLIPRPLWNGILRGHRVKFQAVKVGDEKVTNEPVVERVVGPNDTTILLDLLESYTLYYIRVTAYTNVGDGPEATIYAGKIRIQSSGNCYCYFISSKND